MRRLLLSLVAVFSITPLSACRAVDILEATIPDEGYKAQVDIAYATEPHRLLDIYVPDGTGAEVSNAPVLIFYHGGAWQQGNKDDYSFVGEAFATLGYITVIPNYRLYPEVSFPTFIEDSAKALAWVHNNIAQYGGDPNTVFISGHSAGAHIAMMLALNDTYIKAAGGNSKWIKGAIGLAGPYDFLPLTDKNYIALFSTAKKQEDTQPITFAAGKHMPIMLATGKNDGTVEPRNSIALANKLKDSGSPVELYPYDNVNHMTIMLSLAYGFRERSPLRKDMAAFMNKYK